MENLSIKVSPYTIPLIDKSFRVSSGISSVVRRCIDKETGKEYAAKIMDIGAADANDPRAMLDATRQEINILRTVMGHPYISRFPTVPSSLRSNVNFQLSFRMCSSLTPSSSWCSSFVVTVNSSITSHLL